MMATRNAERLNSVTAVKEVVPRITGGMQ